MTHTPFFATKHIYIEFYRPVSSFDLLFTENGAYLQTLKRQFQRIYVCKNLHSSVPLAIEMKEKMETNKHTHTYTNPYEMALNGIAVKANKY